MGKSMSSILLEARLTCALGMGDNHENNVISPNSVVCVWKKERSWFLQYTYIIVSIP